MNHKRTVLVGLALVVGAVFAVQIGYGGLPLQDGARNVSIQAIEDHPDRYVGERVTVEGWYQGGIIRDANPVCANTREGLQKEPYGTLYVIVPENSTLYTDYKYRFTGVLRDGSAVDRVIPESEPVFLPESIESLGKVGDCSFDPDTGTN
jgi:hypothetical protein